MEIKLWIEGCVIVGFVTVTPWWFVPPTQAEVGPVGPDILQQKGAHVIADTQTPMPSDVPMVKDPSTQLIWVDDIMNALGLYFRTNYPAANFSSYLRQLTVMRGAVDRGDRRAVKVEMGTFLTMLVNRDDGISEGAAEELRNFARVVMPAQEYGVIFPGLEVK